MGWPGSVHDNRPWTNCSLKRNSALYFSESEDLLADSAFQPSNILVPAFKKPPRGELGDDKRAFNTELAKARIKVEHCIGILKARFQMLTNIRLMIVERDDMWRIIRFVLVACMLHNLLLAEVEADELVALDEPHDNRNNVNDAEGGELQATNDNRRTQLLNRMFPN
ncbi:MAG: transposase family protein [Gloeomargaritales cyanobacterium]